MAFDRSAKRRRLSPGAQIPRIATPPSFEDTAEQEMETTSKAVLTDRLLDRAASILTKEAAAVASVADLYRHNMQARKGLSAAIDAILHAQHTGGKLVLCGVGKSAYIAMKATATFKSLGVAASFLHACEAVHGDLGDVRPIDVLLFFSFSGRTPELVNLLPHIPEQTRIMAMSSHMSPLTCPLLAHRDDGILLPAPIPEKEEDAFGVSAPTLSTTVAIAVADMLALTVADELHSGQTKQVFQKNHPGGAIGMKQNEIRKLHDEGIDFTVLELPSPSISGSDMG